MEVICTLGALQGEELQGSSPGVEAAMAMQCGRKLECLLS